MKLIFSKEIDDLFKRGKSLSNIGVNNWALDRDQALFVLKHFSLHQIPVLGGDVYESMNGVMQTTYDNWYCDPLPGEKKKEFAMRSIAKSKAYIEAYEAKKSQKLFFALVPDIANKN